MALQTQLQYTETNLVGYLNESVDTSDTTIYVRFYDRVTGDARTPLATTLMFVIDKGSSTQPSSAYEIILATSHSTTAGVTTLTGCVRGLEFSGVALTQNTSLRKNHVARAEVGTVDLHYLTSNIVATLKGVGDQPIGKVYSTPAARDSDVPTPTAGMYAYITSTSTLWFYDGTRWCMEGTAPSYADDTARDVAITNPREGMFVYNVADGTIEFYISGSWTAMGTSTTPNASTSAAGKAQQSTDAENALSTTTGSTGAPLFVNPSAFSVTGSQNKVPICTSATGELDKTWLPDEPFVSAIAGENLSVGDIVYRKQSDGKFYKALNTSAEASNVVGTIMAVVTTGSNAYAQTAGEVTYSAGGLTAGASVYLAATAGTLTTTCPTLSSGSTYPVCVGRALSTTTYELFIQRLQRCTYTIQTIDGSSSSYTLSIGFPIAHAAVTYLEYATNSTAVYTYNGYYVPSANSISGTSVENKFIQLIGPSNAAPSSNNYYYTPSVSGTDLVLTRTTVGSGVGSPLSRQSMIQIFEAL